MISGSVLEAKKEMLAKCEMGVMIRIRCRKFYSFAIPFAAVSAGGKWSDQDRVLLSSRRCSTRQVSFIRLKVSSRRGRCVYASRPRALARSVLVSRGMTLEGASDSRLAPLPKYRLSHTAFSSTVVWVLDPCFTTNTSDKIHAA
jgi:hypothetical protein